MVSVKKHKLMVMCTPDIQNTGHRRGVFDSSVEVIIISAVLVDGKDVVKCTPYYFSGKVYMLRVVSSLFALGINYTTAQYVQYRKQVNHCKIIDVLSNCSSCVYICSISYGTIHWHVIILRIALSIKRTQAAQSQKIQNLSQTVCRCRFRIRMVIAITFNGSQL